MHHGRLGGLEAARRLCGQRTGADVEQPWANSAEAEVVHTSWNTPETFAAAADVAAAVACVTNRSADVLRLPSGAALPHSTHSACLVMSALNSDAWDACMAIQTHQ